MNFTILRFDSLGSTNTEALNQAKKGAQEGLCIITRQQAAGRGRQGRVWVSERDSGLYFSIILRPKIENKFFPLLTLMSAVAVAEVLRDLYDLKPDIKWANDVHINGKKICGILAEMTDTMKGTAVVVGIGINLKSSNFPTEITEIATSIEAEKGQAANVEVLLASLTKYLGKYYEILSGTGGAARIRQAWAENSTYFSGKKVRVALESETIFGETCGLEENGALRVKTEDGKITIVQAGDVVSLRKAETN